MFLFTVGYIGNFAGVDDILRNEPCFFVIWYAHQVNGIPGHPELDVIVAIILKLHLTADVLVIFPVFNRGHFNRDFYRDQIIKAVFIHTDLFVEKLVRSVDTPGIQSRVTV